MRVAIVAHYYPPHVGGLEIVAQKHAASAVRLGQIVDVITCAFPTERPRSSEDGPLSVHRLPAVDFTDKRSGIPFPLIGLTGIMKMIEVVRNSDIVHIHDVFYPVSWLAAILATRLRKPVFLTQHVALVVHTSVVVVMLQRLVYSTVGSFVLRKASNIFVYNANVSDFLLRRGISDDVIVQMRSGVDVQYFTPAEDNSCKQQLRTRYGLPLDVPIVLFVGRFVPKKRLSALFDARSPQFHVLFVGIGNVPDSMRSEPGVTFAGPYSHSEMRDLYRLSDLFVLPAVGEIFTLAMQEAMSCGLPVITSDDPGYHRYNLDRDLIAFTDASPEALRWHIHRILSDDSLRRSMSTYSRELACSWFDWDLNVATLFQTYAEALAAPSTEREPSGLKFYEPL